MADDAACQVVTPDDRQKCENRSILTVVTNNCKARLVPVYSIMWLLCSGLHAAHVRRADLSALLDLYRILGGEQWKDRAGWDPTGTADPCTTHWHGVGCDDPCDAVLDATVLPRGVSLLDATRVPCRKGRITSIRLRDNRLHGNISSWHSVAELHELSRYLRS